MINKKYELSPFICDKWHMSLVTVSVKFTVMIISHWLGKWSNKVLFDTAYQIKTFITSCNPPLIKTNVLSHFKVLRLKMPSQTLWISVWYDARWQIDVSLLTQYVNYYGNSKERIIFFLLSRYQCFEDQSNYRSSNVTVGKKFLSRELIVMKHAILSTHHFVIVNRIDVWLLDIFTFCRKLKQNCLNKLEQYCNFFVRNMNLHLSRTISMSNIKSLPFQV